MARAAFGTKKAADEAKRRSRTATPAGTTAAGVRGLAEMANKFRKLAGTNPLKNTKGNLGASKGRK